MKTLRSNRGPANKTTRRQRLAATLLGSRSHFDSRRLLCEQLERRYALHGMDWWGESSDRFEVSETPNFDDIDSGSSFAHIRTWEVANRSFRPEPKLTEFKLSERFATGEGSVFEDRSDEKPCDHSFGMKGEGEYSPGSFFDQGWRSGPSGSAKAASPNDSANDSLKNDGFSKPPANIGEPAQPKPVIGEVARPQLTNSQNTGAGPTSPAKETPQPRPASVQSSTRTLDSTNVLGFVIRAIDFTSNSRGLGSDTNSTNSAIVARSIPNSSSASAAPSSAARLETSPTLTSLKPEAATTSSQSTAVGRANLSSSDSVRLNGMSKDSERSLSLSNSWQRSLPGTASDSASTEKSESDGLLSELRSVIEKLANDRAEQKADLDSTRRQGQSLDSRQVDEFFNSDRRQYAFDDGMLELAATTERLSRSTAAVDRSNQVSNDMPHRSQLIASLELNREFDLAGQSMDSLKSVVDPTSRIHSARVAAEDRSHGNEEFSSNNAATKPVEAEASVWQRSILPLSFLAIGSLLVRSRKKYREHRSNN